MTETEERRNGYGRRGTDGFCQLHSYICTDFTNFKAEVRNDIRSKAPLWIVIPLVVMALGFAGWSVLNQHSIDRNLAVISERQKTILTAMGLRTDTESKHNSSAEY